ncbi:MAG: hypothetical protein R3F14_19050 [Polyangiaceae bacterium]
MLLAAAPALAQDGGAQQYPVAYVDRPLTLPSLGVSPDVTFDATQIVQDPNAAERTLQTNLAFAGGLTFGILDDLEVRASIGTIRFVPEFQYLEPKLGLTFRFVGAESFNMGIRAETTALTLPGEAGIRVEASLPFLVRLGSSARIDLAPGAPVTFQEKKAVTVGLNVPVAFAFQVVEVLHIGARTSATILDFSDPGQNLVILSGSSWGCRSGRSGRSWRSIRTSRGTSSRGRARSSTTTRSTSRSSRRGRRRGSTSTCDVSLPRRRGAGGSRAGHVRGDRGSGARWIASEAGTLIRTEPLK